MDSVSSSSDLGKVSRSQEPLFPSSAHVGPLTLVNGSISGDTATISGTKVSLVGDNTLVIGGSSTVILPKPTANPSEQEKSTVAKGQSTNNNSIIDTTTTASTQGGGEEAATNSRYKLLTASSNDLEPSGMPTTTEIIGADSPSQTNPPRKSAAPRERQRSQILFFPFYCVIIYALSRAT